MPIELGAWLFAFGFVSGLCWAEWRAWRRSSHVVYRAPKAESKGVSDADVR